MGTYKVISQTYRDEKGILCSRDVLVINDKLYKINYVGFVWSNKVWKNDKTGYTRGDGVFVINGAQYRISKKTAKPLKLAEGEDFQPIDFKPIGVCVIWK